MQTGASESGSDTINNRAGQTGKNLPRLSLAAGSQRLKEGVGGLRGKDWARYDLAGHSEKAGFYSRRGGKLWESFEQNTMGLRLKGFP